jgi:hypothetical protein
VFAEAKPFVPGGYANAERNENGPGPRLDPNTGQFTIARLIPDASYDVTFRGFSEFGRESQAKGLRTYAPVVLGGVRVAPGEIVDLGTVDLSQGGTLAGTVTDTDGAPLANIRLTAVPALTNGEDRHNFEIETFTDEQGHYEFHGVDRNQRYYDVIASPRFRSGDVFGQLAGTKYAEERVRMIDVNNPLKITGIDFALTAASGALIGTIRTVDGGTLVPAFENGNNQAGVRGANIVLHFDGAVLDDNPLGEIQETTSPDGTFRIDGLKPGAYTFRGIASGYSTALKKIVVAKTGTTNDFRDNWTVGYTPQLVTAVWVGNNDNSAMTGVDGITGAAPIWHDYMEAALASEPVKNFELPAGLTIASICPDGSLAEGFNTGITEVFLNEALPTTRCHAQKSEDKTEDPGQTDPGPISFLTRGRGRLNRLQ